jgi:hypothetical protein
MLKIDYNIIQNIQKYNINHKVIIEFTQFNETYLYSDYLINVPNIATGMSDDGKYELSNATITLSNTTKYFSKLFYYELPINKVVQIYRLIGTTEVLLFRGKVTDWYLTREIVSLTITS